MMAGEGARFHDRYGDLPKPLIPIEGRPMISWAVESLGIKGRFHFVIRNNISKRYYHELKSVLGHYTEPRFIVEVDHLTQGPVCSALLSRPNLNTQSPLIVTNCDQIMHWQAERFENHLKNSSLDGIVVTYPTQKPMNSYIKLNSQGLGERVAEKEVISEHSLNGIHYFKTGEEFITAAEEMIRKDIRVNGEFYIAPVYNQMIEAGKKVGIYPIEAHEHWAVGIPDDLEKYLKHRKRREAI